MSNTSRNNFLQIKEAYAGVFSALERTAAELGIRFCLIGAQSRDVWTKHLELQIRETTDIDYSVEMNDIEKWELLKKKLVEECGFNADVREPYRFHFQQQIIDIVPFGGISVNNEVTLRDPVMVLSVAGFSETSSNGLTLIEGWNVVTLPGLCFSKLISFSEKPHNRTKDFDDFLFILTNYGNILEEKLFADKLFMEMITTGTDGDIAAANLLAREICAVAGGNTQLCAQITAVLLTKLNGYTVDEILNQYDDIRDYARNYKQLRLLAEVITVLENT